MKAVTLTVAYALGALMLLNPGFNGGAFAAPILVDCKPYKNCEASSKPCQLVIRQQESRALRGSTAAGAPPIGKAAIRVRLCSGVNDTCSGGPATQNVQVYVVNNKDFVYQANLATNVKTDTGGYTSIPAHTAFVVTCTSIASSCHIAWQHCRQQLPLQAPGQKSKGKLERGLKTK